MSADRIEVALARAVGAERTWPNASIAPFTTFKVGGPADWLVEAQTAAEIAGVVAVARDYSLPVTALGGGSNVLVADAGVRGLVVRLHGGDVSGLDATRVRADAGVTINGLVRWTIARGLAGLEAWAGTPGTVGGAIHGNTHFQGRLVSELIESVTLLTRDGRVEEVAVADMEFGYDRSRLQRSRELVIAAVFRVGAGDVDALRAVARESLAFRKRTQPLASPSAGCIFQNPDPARDAVPPDIPPSAGALVDRAGFKNAETGGARVSPTHANFIVNDGGATAEAIRRLIERCKTGVRDRFGVQLREEIVLLGFDA